jgi:hypothetical protein
MVGKPEALILISSTSKPVTKNKKIFKNFCHSPKKES